MREKLLSELSDWLGVVSESSPCGNKLDDDIKFQQMTSKVEITEEISEWRKLEKIAHSYLAKTHNISLFVTYTKILVHTERSPIKGLAKGLLLIAHSLEHHWECIYPEINEDDPEEAFIDRINALANLDDYKQLVFLLRKKINVLSIGLGSYTLDDLVAFEQGHPVDGKQPLVGLTDDEESAYTELIQWFNLSLELALEIGHLFLEKSKESFREFDQYLLPMLKEGSALNKGSALDSGAAADIVANNGKAETSVTVPVVSVSGAINNRNDVVKAINLICDYYQSEPSSPVPLILKRAKKMVNMDYREIYKELNLGSDSNLDGVFGRFEESDS